MKVVTIASELDHPFLERLLIPSCATLGLDLVILHSTKDDFQLGDKRSIFADYLAQHPGSDELIVFTDAYDTLFIRGEQYIRDLYTAFPQPVVFSAEANSWPLGALGLALRDTPPTYPYPFLNSGGFIGPASVLLDLYNRHPKPPNERFELLRKLRHFDYDTNVRYAHSDQYYWTLVQLVEGETIALDHQAKLFENFGPRVPDVWHLQVLAGHYEFMTKGRAAASYQHERERLEDSLRSPSQAAHIHFSNPMSKAVVLDLLDEGKLPGWLRDVTAPTPPDAPGATVVTVDHFAAT